MKPGQRQPLQHQMRLRSPIHQIPDREQPIKRSVKPDGVQPQLQCREATRAYRPRRNPAPKHCARSEETPKVRSSLRPWTAVRSRANRRSKAMPNGSIEPRNRPTARIEASHVFASLKRLAIASLGGVLRTPGCAVAGLGQRLRWPGLPCHSLSLGRGRPPHSLCSSGAASSPAECIVPSLLDPVLASRLSAHVA